MLFLEALKELECQRPMRRAAWNIEEGYLIVMPGMKYVWKIVLHPNPNAGNFIFSVEDFTAEDWVEYTQPTCPIEALVGEEKSTEAA